MARITEKDLREYVKKYGDTDAGKAIAAQLPDVCDVNKNPPKITSQTLVRTTHQINTEFQGRTVVMIWILIIMSFVLSSKTLAIIALGWNLVLGFRQHKLNTYFKKVKND